MPRIVCIDFGEKRCGIATTDPLRLIASPAGYVPTAELLTWLTAYFKNESVERLLVGLPTRLHGESSEIEGSILQFIAVFQHTFPQIPVSRVDERFTSKMAAQSLIDMGTTKKQRREKGRIDETAAAIMLRDFLHYGTEM